MTDSPVPDAAALARDTLLKIPATEQGDVGAVALAVTAALHEHGRLHDPAEVAALRAVADAASELVATGQVFSVEPTKLRKLRRALDVLPAQVAATEQ